MKQYKFKENRISTISNIIGAVIFCIGFIISIITLIISFFIIRYNDYPLIFLTLSVFIPSPFIFLGKIFSKCDKFTNIFIKEIKQKLTNAKTLEELYVVEKELWDEAVDDDKIIRLSYHSIIKELMNEVHHKIEILEKYNIK